MADKYKYGKEFQIKVAALLLRDPVFLNQYFDVVSSSYFEYSYLSSIVRVGLELFEKFNQVPSKDTLRETIQEFCVSYKLSVLENEAIFNDLDEIYKADLSDSDIVKDEIISFGKHQSLKNGVLKIADIIENQEDYDKAREIIDSALLVGTNTLDLGTNFWGSLNNIKVIMGDICSPQRKIKTQLSYFDSQTLGGPGRKELWVLMGLPGVGKSQIMINFGIAALEQGFSVVHITIGDLTENDVFMRYASAITRTSHIDVMNMTSDFLRRVEKIKIYSERYLRIKYYPSYTANPQTIRSYLSKLVTVDKIQPGLLIIDYPDEFKPYNDDLYQNSGRQYSELGKIASDFDCLIWVPSQVTRAEMKDPNALLKMNNVADSWRKPQKADGVVSLNQTVEEYYEGKARLWVDKVRRGSKCFLVSLNVDYSMSLVWQAQAQIRSEN